MTAMEIAAWDGRTFGFEPEKTALLAIDMQKDFLDPEGYVAYRYGDPVEMRKIIPSVAKLTTWARDLGCKVVHTREGFQPDLSDLTALRAERRSVGKEGPLGRFLIRGEPCQDFVEECRPLPDEPVLDKPGFGAFGSSDLDAVLKARGVTHLIVCGITTQCCVHSTLREAVDRGYWCLTVADCCAAVEPQWHDAAISLIASENHLFGWVCELSDITS